MCCTRPLLVLTPTRIARNVHKEYFLKLWFSLYNPDFKSILGRVCDGSIIKESKQVRRGPNKCDRWTSSPCMDKMWNSGILFVGNLEENLYNFEGKFIISMDIYFCLFWKCVKKSWFLTNNLTLFRENIAYFQPSILASSRHHEISLYGFIGKFGVQCIWMGQWLCKLTLWSMSDNIHSLENKNLILIIVDRERSE